MWKIINSGPRPADELMALDKTYLETLKEPTLHFYRFKGPSLTYGLLMKLSEHLDEEGLKKHHIKYAIRPTGGGALFHMWDLAFSVIIPMSHIPHLQTTLDRYLAINQLTELALRPFLKSHITKEFLAKTPEGCVGERFCMAKPTQYDVMIEGKKCVGAAQRVTKTTLLHQATISLCAPDPEILKDCLKDPRAAQNMLEQSFFFADFDYKQNARLEALQTQIETSLEKVFQGNFDQFFQK
jgi:lipoate-protein ligase A